MVRTSGVQSVLEALKTEIQTQNRPGHYLPNEGLFARIFGKHVPRHDIASTDNHLSIVDALRRRSYSDLLAACTDHYRYSEMALEETMTRDMALPVATEPAE